MNGLSFVVRAPLDQHFDNESRSYMIMDVFCDQPVTQAEQLDLLKLGPIAIWTPWLLEAVL